jgi:hypothetical protein
VPAPAVAALAVRPEPSLNLIGATPEGKKELVGLTDGVRESHRAKITIVSNAADAEDTGRSSAAVPIPDHLLQRGTPRLR